MCFVFKILFEYSKALFSHNRFVNKIKHFLKGAVCGVVRGVVLLVPALDMAKGECFTQPLAEGQAEHWQHLV